MARRQDKTTDDNIILTGFMGTGKSSVGRLLAKHLGYEFVDTDEWIAARCGKAIHDIFRDQGEAAFREMEAALARELGGLKKKVIATGGRLMLDAANAAALIMLGASGVQTGKYIMQAAAGATAHPVSSAVDRLVDVRLRGDGTKVGGFGRSIRRGAAFSVSRGRHPGTRGLSRR